jgi:hypothetical protein
MCDDASRQSSPVDGVEGDAHAKRRGLNERASGVGDAEREYELVELRQEQRRDRGSDEIAATAEE